jgi:hypothetical protein
MWYGEKVLLVDRDQVEDENAQIAWCCWPSSDPSSRLKTVTPGLQAAGGMP